MSALKFLLNIFIVLVLTVVTQVGGLIWILSLIITRKTRAKKRWVFPLLYLVFNLVLIPPIASYLGREKLPYADQNLEAQHWFYPLMFRNYVKPELKSLLTDSAKSLEEQDISITYLDANFPFMDGFPLLPHLSHNDGKKIDLAFMYLDDQGQPTALKPSRSGYGAFVHSHRNKTVKHCKSQGFWQYDFPKYLTFGGTSEPIQFDARRTRKLLTSLMADSKTSRIFIEPHLRATLNLSNAKKIGFHGCRAVRHDDHIHLQIK